STARLPRQAAAMWSACRRRQDSQVVSLNVRRFFTKPRLGEQPAASASLHAAPLRHGDHGVTLSWSDWNLHLLAGCDQILLEQVRVVRLGHSHAGVAEDLRELVDVAAGLQPARSEGV